MDKKKVVVIGSGFAGLSAATFLADKGYQVTVLEKNNQAGGRARVFKEQGFTFDMGPSWYWMPDVFDKYFAQFGKKVSDYYFLKRLDPSYRVYFGKSDFIDLPAGEKDLFDLFNSIEKGSATKLNEFLAQGKYKYEVGVKELVYKPSRSITEFFDFKLLKGVFKLDVFNSIHSHVRDFFKNERLIKLMEFPILFLGATPKNTPALYSLMNYADMSLGTWYPMGGMHEIVKAMVSLAESKGVKFLYNEEVLSISVKDKKAQILKTFKNNYEADIVVAGGDYHHIETHLLEAKHRSYSPEYWDSRVMAPSSLIFYLGINKKISNLLHHNLFFDGDFEMHAKEIYEEPKWPTKPLFYVSCPSMTDETVAPEGMENLFILIPLAPDLQDTDALREKYFDMVMNRLETLIGQTIKENIIYKRSYAHNDFKADYHSFKGNAYGLANTLKQTAILKPSLKSKKIRNMYYTGQLTVPGPGVPPALISGEVVAREIMKEFAN